MFSFSNCLSFLRAPLAFLFLWSNPLIRTTAIFLSMVSDSLDGFVARKTNSTSKFGTVLDPLMDKFFVYFGLIVFFLESKIELWQVFSMLSRDFAIGVFSFYLLFSKKYKRYTIHAFRWGKISTALQFLVLLTLCWNVFLPWQLYSIFILFGIFALIELVKESTQKAPQKTTK
jgi:CDP-diacylglycerol--glycerol-3-phosphate 3-phosphatidyltransferase